MRLQEQLAKESKARSEEKNALSQVNEQQKQEIGLLRQELIKVNNICNELRNLAKKADAEIISYKKEHDIEFNTLRKAFEDSRKINESLQERLREKKENNESHVSISDTSSQAVVRVNVANLQQELAEKKRVIDDLNKKLQQHEDSNKRSQKSIDSPKDTERFSGESSPKSSLIQQLQKDLHQKQGEIETLTQQLRKISSNNQKISSAVVDGDANNTRLSTTNVSQLRELAESQMMMKTSGEKPKDDKQLQTSFDKDISSADVVDGSTSDQQRSSQLQKELEDVYKKNEELRKAVSENITLVELNRQLKQDLGISEQRSCVLENELENYTKKLKDTNSDVTRLSEELARTRTLNSDYMSQLQALRRQREQTTKLHEETLDVAKENDR